ncbi:MAG: hypothetical protein EBR82_85645 [Caulobacteraceae bacterium]|nr:hypothetical protein [Caulobacteraceae bacterium]
MIDLPEHSFGDNICPDEALWRIRKISDVLDGGSKDFFATISEHLDMNAPMLKGMSWEEWSDAAMVRMGVLVRIVLNGRIG